MKIILASKSPRRRKIFRDLGIKHKTWSGDVDETVKEKTLPHKTVKILAERKAKACLCETGENDALIIAADTVVALGDTILGKPASDDDARKMLNSMKGTHHAVYSGYCCLYQGKKVSGYQKTSVYFRDFSDSELEKYIATGEHRDKAGSYGIQGNGGYFVKKIDGDINNVVGLPLLKMRDDILKKLGIDLFNLPEVQK